jgi:putative ABC transport system permease protein
VAVAMLAGFFICCGFALLPLLRIRRIPPLAAVRAQVAAGEPAGRDPLRLLVYVLLVLGVTGFTISQSGGWQRGLAYAGGLGVAFAFLALVASAGARIARALSRRPLPYVVRQGLSNLHRPNNQTRLFVFAVGLGTFLILTLLLNRDLLLRRLAVSDARTSPNLYLVDVQQDQVAGVTGLVQSLGLPVLESAAMITMRIRAVNGRQVAELFADRSTPDWVLKREYRSTYRDHLTPTESLAAGEFIGNFSPAPGARIPVSLEHDLAQDLSVGVDGTIDMDVQGVPMEFVVTSIRKVDWSRFTLNFFMVFPVGVLEGAPAFHVLTTRIPDGQSSGPLQRELACRFPNVSPVDLKLILSTVRGVLDKIGWVVRFMAAFTVASGFVILVGAVLTGRGQRLREAALLRTLGASARQIRTILLTEYTALGLLAAGTGCLLALAANAALAHFVFKAPVAPSAVTCMAAVFATTGLTILVSRAMNRGVLTHPPLETLRAQ